MLYVGITLETKKFASAKTIKIVVDASSSDEAVEIANSIIADHNKMPMTTVWSNILPFESGDQFITQIIHPGVAIVRDLNK